MTPNDKTIVGGRSLGGKFSAVFPRGIEILLKKAKVDENFRRSFLASPIEVAEDIRLELSENEKLVLANTDGSILEQMIECVAVPKQHVKVFQGTKVTAMLALALAATVMPFSFAAGGAREADIIHVAVQWYAEKELRTAQHALEQYFMIYGAYPSTLEWLLDDPLKDYIEPVQPYYRWYSAYQYKGIVNDSNRITNYSLVASEGSRTVRVNVGPPINPYKHAFWDPNPLEIIFPKSGNVIFIDENQSGQIVMNATHTDRTASVRWYLDGEEIAHTKGIHAVPLAEEISSDEHWLFIMDSSENYVCVNFNVER